MKTILISGLIAGGFAAIWGCLMCFGQLRVTPAVGMAIGYLTMLLGLTTIFYAVKRRRDQDQGGVIRFWAAFRLGLAISVVAAVVYVLVLELTIVIAGFETLAGMMVAMYERGGSSASELSELRTFLNGSYRSPLVRMPITFIEFLPVGLLVSLVSAALLRNPRFMPARAAEQG
jgi:uncharacterized membrane protein